MKKELPDALDHPSTSKLTVILLGRARRKRPMALAFDCPAEFFVRDHNSRQWVVAPSNEAAVAALPSWFGKRRPTCWDALAFDSASACWSMSTPVEHSRTVFASPGPTVAPSVDSVAVDPSFVVVVALFAAAALSAAGAPSWVAGTFALVAVALVASYFDQSSCHSAAALTRLEVALVCRVAAAEASACTHSVVAASAVVAAAAVHCPMEHKQECACRSWKASWSCDRMSWHSVVDHVTYEQQQKHWHYCHIEGTSRRC